jgi:hypothetical protein
VRTPEVWFAVKQGPGGVVGDGGGYAADLRYEAGLATLKERGQGWRDIQPLRPHTTRLGDGARPELLTPAGRGRLFGERLRVGPGGVVFLAGGFRTPAGRWLRRRLTVRYEPIGCGVRVVIRARRAGRCDYAASFASRRGRRSRIESSRVADAGQTVSFDAPARVRHRRLRLRRRSSTRARRDRFSPGPPAELTLTFCASGS